MAATILTPPTEIIHLTGISWQTYERLLDELRDGQGPAKGQRRLRLTYNRGNLEIMAPSPEHERYKKLAGRFVETLAEEIDIRIEPLGSTTFKQPELSGAEPDECFYIYNTEIAGFLQQAETIGYLELVKTFRTWLKDQTKSQGG